MGISRQQLLALAILIYFVVLIFGCVLLMLLERVVVVL